MIELTGPRRDRKYSLLRFIPSCLGCALENLYLSYSTTNCNNNTLDSHSTCSVSPVPTFSRQQLKWLMSGILIDVSLMYPVQDHGCVVRKVPCLMNVHLSNRTISLTEIGLPGMRNVEKARCPPGPCTHGALVLTLETAAGARFPGEITSSSRKGVLNRNNKDT